MHRQNAQNEDFCELMNDSASPETNVVLVRACTCLRVCVCVGADVYVVVGPVQALTY